MLYGAFMLIAGCALVSFTAIPDFWHRSQERKVSTFLRGVSLGLGILCFVIAFRHHGCQRNLPMQLDPAG